MVIDVLQYKCYTLNNLKCYEMGTNKDSLRQIGKPHIPIKHVQTRAVVF